MRNVLIAVQINIKLLTVKKSKEMIGLKHLNAGNAITVSEDIKLIIKASSGVLFLCLKITEVVVM